MRERQGVVNCEARQKKVTKLSDVAVALLNLQLLISVPV